MAPGGSASHTASFDDSLPMSLIDPGTNFSTSLGSWLVCSTLNQGAGNVRTAIEKRQNRDLQGEHLLPNALLRTQTRTHSDDN